MTDDSVLKWTIQDPRAFIAVVGGVNMDIGGKAFHPLVPGDSNPGLVTMSLGGVGRNIAHNIALMGARVELLTAFGDDLHAAGIQAGCAQHRIAIHNARIVPGTPTSIYLYLSDETGKMALAVSDMDICKWIDAEYLESKRDVLDSASLIVADANIPEESVRYLAEQVEVPLFVDPVSTAKAEKLKPYLNRIHTLKPNVVEAEMLSGVKITDRRSLREAAGKLLEEGLKRVFISLGEDGVFAAERGRSAAFPCFKADVKNTTGAGDAFMAGLAYAYLAGLNFPDTVRFASGAAAVSTESGETVNPELSLEKVAARIYESP